MGNHISSATYESAFSVDVSISLSKNYYIWMKVSELVGQAEARVER